MIIGKSFTFEAAHRLQNHDGKCRNLHGHSYKVEVILEGGRQGHGSPEEGMVLDFGKLKLWWRPLESQLDHVTILQETDPLVGALATGRNATAVTTFPWPPTAENLAHWLRVDLEEWLTHNTQGGLTCSVRVYETATSWAASEPPEEPR